MLNKLNFEVAQFAGKEGSNNRYNTLNVKPDRTEATNGHYAVSVTETQEDTINFPAIEDEEIASTFEPFQISVDDAKKIAKAIPSLRSLPVLEHAAICISGNEHAKIAVTNLDTLQVMQPRKIDNKFPDLKAIEPQGDPVLTIGVTPLYLAKLLTFAAKFDPSSVKLTFFGDSKPIRIEARNDKNQEMTALLMTLRMT